ncbi:hypothetical protein UY3_18223 [Chelonia mydas]|uniref:Myb/SANT-like DNA-binding domain-containing protein n=1 Tax=Chelonia mydas TaxID=8469 RepID=M7AI38_CHEMY|nr:hypothetical protein UY3_18223 [Chelonia mydas]
MQSQNRKRAPAWTEWEVLDLITVWGEESVLSELRSKRRNAKTFQKISEAMRDRGYMRDATQCHVKLKEGGAATNTLPLSVDSNDGVLSAIAEDFAHGEDEEEDNELGKSTQHTVLPNSQDLFITLTEIPSQLNEAREETSGERGFREKRVHVLITVLPSPPRLVFQVLVLHTLHDNAQGVYKVFTSLHNCCSELNRLHVCCVWRLLLLRQSREKGRKRLFAVALMEGGATDNMAYRVGL